MMYVENSQAVMAVRGHIVAELMTELVAQLDGAHSDGLAVPAEVPNAVAVLTALGRAWEANGRGEQCPDDALRALGVQRAPEVPGQLAIERP